MAYRAIAFCRVSSQQQDYQRQISDLKPLMIETDGYHEDEIYIIKYKESATKNDVNNRKSIAELKDVIEHNKIEAVYCTEASRLARRGDVLYAVLALLEERKISLVIQTPSLIRTYEDGKPNAIAHVVLAFLGQVAQQEMELKKERQKSGYAQKVKDGKVCSSKVVFGYLRDKDGYAVIDKDKAPVVIDIFKAYLEGLSSSAIWEKYKYTGIFKEASNKTGMNIISNILKDTTYIGKNPYFLYPPIIDNSLFQEVQNKKKGNKMIKSKLKYIYYSQGLLKLDGKYTMTPDAKEVQYVYYDFETKKSLGINMNVMDSLLWNLAAEAKASIESTANAERYAAMKKEITVIDSKLEGIRKAKEDNEEQQKRVNTLYIKGKIKEDDYNFRIEDLEGQLSHILNEEEQLQKTKLELQAVVSNEDVKNEWMKQVVEYNNINNITDDKTRQAIIKETIEHVDVIWKEKGVFDIYVYFYDAVMNTQIWRYRYIRRGPKKYLYAVYNDNPDEVTEYEDMTNSIVERIKRNPRNKQPE